jgi:hypothetical protein
MSPQEQENIEIAFDIDTSDDDTLGDVIDKVVGTEEDNEDGKNTKKRTKKRANKKRKAEEGTEGEAPKKPRNTLKSRYPLVKDLPKNAYNFYFIERCAEIQSQVPEGEPKKSASELSKMIAPEWQKLPKEGRAKWEELAAKDKERYYDEVRSHGYVVENKNKFPSRSNSAYFIYLKDRITDFSDLPYKEARKKVAESWNEAKKNQDPIIAEYKEKAKVEHDLWLERKAEFEKNNENAGTTAQ